MKIQFSKTKRKMDMGEGSRVEVDLVDILKETEGILVGDSAKGFICVLAETRETNTYPPRPFRVNAGAIHQYIYVGNNETKYLSELKAGDSVVVTDGTNERTVKVGRVKIEKRKFERIVLESGVSATLQVADSVFILGEGKAEHFCNISNESIGYCEMTDVARHKGKVIDETIIEK